MNSVRRQQQSLDIPEVQRFGCISSSFPLADHTPCIWQAPFSHLIGGKTSGYMVFLSANSCYRLDDCGRFIRGRQLQVP